MSKKIKDSKVTKTSTPMIIGFLLILIGLAGVLNIAADKLKPILENPPTGTPTTPETPDPGEVVVMAVNFEGFEKFTSEQEFQEYAERNKEEIYYGGGFGMMGAVRTLSEPMVAESMDTGAPAPMAKDALGIGGAERYSDTNVQVVGIDEPDIVKTNGKEIYLTNTMRYYMGGVREMKPDIAPWPGNQNKTSVISAVPVADLEEIAEIEKAGNLLLSDNTLIIFSGNDIFGYDIENPEEPSKEWEVKLENSHYIVSSRLYNDKIYLVTSQHIQYNRPCPIIPLSINGNDIEIRCADIYHPVNSSPIDSTFTVLALDATTGEVKDKVSFVGKVGSSVTYMSENAIYTTYSLPGDFVAFFHNFLTEEADDLIDDIAKEKIRKLVGYDISSGSKMTELEVILNNYYNSLTDDERLRVQNEFNNQLQDYYGKHNRELEKTAIVKISTDKLEVEAIGEVPGSPLNQFSLDEYANNLRIAVTIGQGWSRFGRLGESVSDVYVLDKNLKTVGSVKGMGEGERIYSVRFLQDKGFVVTFKQIDPFYVLDLSDPGKPEIKGELKIPGYSSYLHPITKDRILGIGKENNDVKVSLFDVSNPSKPKEVAKYALDEYWSDILNTHHAFLLDDKHKVFFMPGQRGGYIFSYTNDELKLKKAVSDISAKRALYIDDYLYIIGENEIVVLNELDWQEVNKLDLE